MKRVMDTDQDRAFLRTFVNHLEALHKESQTVFHLTLINLHCSNGFRSKFKQCNLCNFCTFPKTNIWICNKWL